MELTVFHQITDNQFKNNLLEQVVLEKKSLLFEQNTPIKFIYFVHEGELNIFKNKQFMWQAKTNEFIGLTSFFTDSTTYSYTVKAASKSIILKLELKKFKHALTKSNILNAELMKLFCDRIKQTLSKTKSHSVLSKKKQLIGLLIEKSKNSKHNGNIVLNYNSQELSNLINIPHKIVKTTLLDLQSKKLIILSNNNIEILDLKGLQIVFKMKAI